MSTSTGLGLRAQTDCQVVTEKEFKLLGESASYLSWEGMFLESHEAVDVGEDVIVSLRAPGTGLWLDAEARVARTVPLSPDGKVRGVGLRFRRMDENSRAVLRAVLGPRETDFDAAFEVVRHLNDPVPS